MSETITSIRIGDVFVNSDVRIKITNILVVGAHLEYPMTILQYDYVKCGEKGREENRLDAFIQMILDDELVRPASKIYFNISDYRRSHGKNPRGFGRWVFSPYDPSLEVDFLKYAFGITDTYGGAREKAKKMVREMYPGCDVLFVCS